MNESVKESIERITRRFESVMKRHPEADPHTILRIIRDLEIPPIERLERALSFGRYPLFERVSKISKRTPEA